MGDLIAGLGDSKGKLGAARKALERLEKKGQPVAAPLPGPIKQRQERKAGCAGWGWGGSQGACARVGRGAGVAHHPCRAAPASQLTRCVAQP